MSNIEKQVGELISSGDLPTKMEFPVQEVGGNPNVLDMGRLPLIIQLAQLGQAVRVRKVLEESARRRFFRGELNKLTLTANGNRQEAQVLSWISMFVINGGPNPVHFGVNTPLEFIDILVGETRTIDLKDAEKRIESIYYWCDTGNTASVRVEGYY